MGRIHTSVLAWEFWKCNYPTRVFENIACHEAPELFSQYKALTILTGFPCHSGGNSGTAIDQILSWHFVFKYALPVSHADTFNSLIPIIRKAIRTESRYITFEYVMLDSATVVCPLATSWALRVSVIFTSKIMWHPISWNPLSMSHFPSRISSGVKPSIISKKQLLPSSP